LQLLLTFPTIWSTLTNPKVRELVSINAFQYDGRLHAPIGRLEAVADKILMVAAVDV
jgi:hypothetical protein